MLRCAPLRRGACARPGLAKISAPAARPVLPVRAPLLIARCLSSALAAAAAAAAVPSAGKKPRRARGNAGALQPPAAEKRREVREILAEYGLPEDSLPASRRVSPEILRVVLERFREWGMLLSRQPTALRRWQFLQKDRTPEEYVRELDARIGRLQGVLGFTGPDMRRLLVRDARVLWTALDAVKSRVDFYRGLLGSDLLCKVVMRNPPLLTIDRPRERAAMWKSRLGLSDTEAPRLLKHSAILNCRPAWIEIRLRLISERVGGDMALIRSLLLNHGDMLLLSEDNLNAKFALLEGVLDRSAYARQSTAGSLAMFLTRSMKTTIMPRYQRIKEAGVGFARDDVTFFDYFVRTEAMFHRVLGRCVSSPLFLASKQLSAAIAAEKTTAAIQVHPNLLFPNSALNEGVFYCVKQQLQNGQISFSAYNEPVGNALVRDAQVVGHYLIEKQAYRRILVLRSTEPMLTYLPAP